MNIIQAVMIALTKIMLPIIDIVTDLLLTVQLITGWGYDLTCGEYFAEYHVNMGLAYITPAVISALLHIRLGEIPKIIHGRS